MVDCCCVSYSEGKFRRWYDLEDGVKGVPAKMLRTWPPGHGCKEGLGSCDYFSSSAGKWLKAILLSVSFTTGQCDLNIKRAGLVRHLKNIVWGTFLTERKEVAEPPVPVVVAEREEIAEQPGPSVPEDVSPRNQALTELVKRRKLQREGYLAGEKPQRAEDSRPKQRQWCEPDDELAGGVWKADEKEEESWKIREVAKVSNANFARDEKARLEASIARGPPSFINLGSNIKEPKGAFSIFGEDRIAGVLGGPSAACSSNEGPSAENLLPRRDVKGTVGDALRKIGGREG